MNETKETKEKILRFGNDNTDIIELSIIENGFLLEVFAENLFEKKIEIYDSFLVSKFTMYEVKSYYSDNWNSDVGTEIYEQIEKFIIDNQDTQEDYDVYVEHKVNDLKETPLSFEDWKDFNKLMREDENNEVSK